MLNVTDDPSNIVGRHEPIAIGLSRQAIFNKNVHLLQCVLVEFTSDDINRTVRFFTCLNIRGLIEEFVQRSNSALEEQVIISVSQVSFSWREVGVEAARRQVRITGLTLLTGQLAQRAPIEVPPASAAPLFRASIMLPPSGRGRLPPPVLIAQSS